MTKIKPTRILYMEDDPGMARLFKKKLERMGYSVDLARDGEEGLNMYDAGSYDLVAVDHHLPVYDGLEVIRTLASRGNLPPMIMITGTGDEEVAVEAMKLGAGDYVVKDAEGGYLDLLPTVIDHLLTKQRLVKAKQRAEEELANSLRTERMYAAKLARELDLASSIQQTLISSSPASMKGLEMEATWHPAGEMCGDFFSLVPIDDERLAVWMGDVSAKGVPAALIMVLVDTFLKVDMANAVKPGMILSQLGSTLHQLLIEAEQLVTIFIGILDVNDGLLTYSDAGHGQTLVHRNATGEIVKLNAILPPLGVAEEFPVVQRGIYLRGADVLVIYSDGLTEVASSDGELLGLERLKSIISDNHQRSPREIQDAILSMVREFSQGEALADDQTLVIIKLVDSLPSDAQGSLVESAETPAHIWELELASSTESLQFLREWTVSVCKEVRGAVDPERFEYECQLATSEIVTNVIKDAYRSEDGKIDIRAYLFDDRVEFDFFDQGDAFDMESVLEMDLSEPKEGGYGLRITQSVMDEVVYDRTSDGKNHWHVVKGIS